MLKTEDEPTVACIKTVEVKKIDDHVQDIDSMFEKMCKLGKVWISRVYTRMIKLIDCKQGIVLSTSRVK